VGITLVWSFLVSFAILKLVDGLLGLRASAEEEASGLDLSQHAESGYTFVEYGGYGVPTRAAVLSGPPGPAVPERAEEPGPRIAISRNQGASGPELPPTWSGSWLRAGGGASRVAGAQARRP
jgi:Ammonia permease